VSGHLQGTQLNLLPSSLQKRKLVTAPLSHSHYYTIIISGFLFLSARLSYFLSPSHARTHAEKFSDGMWPETALKWNEDT